MKKSETIVYLGTEGSIKTCLGLAEVLADGWSVGLVVAYEGASPKINARYSLAKAVRGYVTKLIDLHPPLMQLIQKILRRKEKGVEFHTLKELCSEYNIPYVMTSDQSLQTLKQKINRLHPSIILSNGWMFRITEDIISLASLISLNCHSSYLPEYRGGNITFAPLINEESESGVTVHQLVGKFDAGKILAQQRVAIDSGETPHSLNVKRAKITGKVLIDALEIAGHKELYLPNPPSPFYFRCDYSTYKHYRRINYLRKLIGLPIKRYEAKERYDI